MGQGRFIMTPDWADKKAREIYRTRWGCIVSKTDPVIAAVAEALRQAYAKGTEAAVGVILSDPDASPAAMAEAIRNLK